MQTMIPMTQTVVVSADRHLPQLPARLRVLLPGRTTGKTTSEPKPRPRAEGTGRQFIILIAFVWGNLERVRVDVHIL